MASNKITAGAPFPLIELPAVGGDKISLGTPQTGFDWRMMVAVQTQA